MISIIQKPLGEIIINGTKIFRFSPESSYADSFGFEWSKYARTYSDATLSADVSRSRLELVLGFPLDFLKNMTVLEVGCGAGRFTEHLVKHAGNVIASDLSNAIYSNSALGASNLLAIQADLRSMPEFSQPVDLVFCRGVIQHTPDPAATIKQLFELVHPGGLVIFDVYRKTGNEWRNFKYFWRPIVKRLWTVESFDEFLSRHDVLLYRWHHRIHKLWNSSKIVRKLIARTPLYWHMNYEQQYPQMNSKQRLDVFRNELVDGFFSYYDRPMTAGEILSVLGDIGQRPYSYDIDRNIFRCKKAIGRHSITLGFTKNGVVTV